MRLKVVIGILGLMTGLAFLVPARGLAQQIEITAPPPQQARPPEFVLPGQPPEVTRPREDDFRSDDVRVRHDPAFVAPLTTTIRTGAKSGVRVGLSGWTAPPGRGNNNNTRELSGVFAIGLSFAWPVEVEPEQPKPAPPAAR